MNLAKPNIKFVEIAARDLKIHPRAQRKLVPSMAKRLAENLNLDAIGVLTAAEYPVDGVLGIYVIDGQHRIWALLAQDCGEWLVTVAIHVDVKTDAAAARLFLDCNRKTTPTAFDRFNNAVLAGAPVESGVSAILARSGLKISAGSADGHLACVAAAVSAYRLDAGSSLERALQIALAAWGKTSAAMDKTVIGGLSRFCARWGGQIDGESLVKKLGKMPGGPHWVISRARARQDWGQGSIAKHAASAILEAYNAGRREKLPDGSGE